jgi:hypothetical protein
MIPASRLLLSALAGSVLLTGLFAQAPAPKLAFPAVNPQGVIKQRVGLTDIEITYNRPGVKGRKIFGGLIPYGQIWRTGADAATRISFSAPVTLNGTAVPAGTYEVFTIPGEAEWTVIVQAVKEKAQWGSYAYDQKNDTARFAAKPRAAGSPVETFAFGFNNLRDTGATLNMFWENTVVPVQIGVDTVGQLVPQIEAVMASAEPKKPYYSAAMFYYTNDLDLNKAAEWMEKAVAEQPKAFWMIYRQGLVLAKKGDKAGALAAANKSKELASGQSGELKEEYYRLNDALIASLK